MLGPAGRPSVTRRKIGYLPEHHRIPHHLTGNTALEYYGGLSNMPMREIRRLRPKLLEMVGLGRWGKTLVRKYSKGMSQRLGLAQAMLHDPDFLILDEPTDGVDPVGRAEIREVLGRFKSEGKTIFLNSHLLQEVELVCDRVAILGRGKLRRMDTVDAIRQHTSLEAVLTLRADESSVRRLLNGRTVLAAESVDPEHLRITVEAPDQPALDPWIDLLAPGRDQHRDGRPPATDARAGVSRSDHGRRQTARRGQRPMNRPDETLSGRAQRLVSRGVRFADSVAAHRPDHAGPVRRPGPLHAARRVGRPLSAQRIPQRPRIPQFLASQETAKTPTAARRIWSRLPESLRHRLHDVSPTNVNEQVDVLRDVRGEFNGMLNNKDLYDPKLWTPRSLTGEGRHLQERGWDNLSTKSSAASIAC